MNKILAFYRDHGTVPIPRLVLMAAVSGIASMLVLGTINTGATAAAHGGPVAGLLAVFLVAQVIYTLAQRYVFSVALLGAVRAGDRPVALGGDSDRRIHDQRPGVRINPQEGGRNDPTIA